ncbi:MAG: CotH kinase family protein [Clostridia bacterium]|nr:CotH kinase family protein [Clostridia bacterium]
MENGKIHFGPNWDFDCGAGNFRSLGYTHWTSVSGERNYFYRGLYNDPLFAALCEKRWMEIRDVVFQLTDYMEGLETYIRQAAARDIEFYPDPRMWWSTPRIYTGQRGEYNDFFDWMNNRIGWLDTQLTSEYPVIGKGADRSSKLFLDLTYDGDIKLPADTVHPSGPNVSAVYNPDVSDTFEVNCRTTHSSVVSMSLYINGVFIGSQDASKTSPFNTTVSSGDLDLTEGAFNVISIIAYNKSGPYRYTYKIIRTSSRALKSVETAVVFNDGLNESFTPVEIDAEIEFPQINVERDGFMALGWVRTGDDTVYAPGESLLVSESSEFRVKWKRNSIFNVMILDEIKEKTVEPDVLPDVVVPEVGPEKQNEKDTSAGTVLLITLISLGAVGIAIVVIILCKHKKRNI